MSLKQSHIVRFIVVTLLITGIVALISIFLLHPSRNVLDNNKTAPNNNQTTPGPQQFSGLKDGQAITSDTIIRLDGLDTTGVTRSELYVDGQIAATSYAYPFDLTFAVAGFNVGEHTIYIKTYDSNGAVRSTSATITVIITTASSTTAPTSSTKVSSENPQQSTTSTVAPPFIVPPAVLPAAPGSLVIEVVPGSETKLHISWSASSDASGISHYDLYRDGTLLTSSPSSSTQAYDRTVVPGHQYSYAIRAVANNNNVSALSLAVSMQLAPSSVWNNTDTPANTINDPTPVEVGMRFRVHTPGTITGLRFYKGPGNTGTHTITLWDESQNRVAVATSSNETSEGWQYAYFSSPVDVNTSENYTISYSLHNGHFSSTVSYFSVPQVKQYITALAAGDGGGNGVYSDTVGAYPSSSYNATNYWVDPLFIPDAMVGGDLALTKQDNSKLYANFPGSNNTGVPAGQELNIYTQGPTVVDQNTTIDGKVIYGGLRILGSSHVTVTNSKIYGNIDIESSTASLTLRDVTVDAGASQVIAIGFNNITMERVNSSGGETGAGCSGNCSISDSWLHGQYLGSGSSAHLGGFLSNGGSNIVLTGNTISCDVPDNTSGGGCSGSAQLYGDFSVNQQVTFDGNLFVATTGAYCTSFGYNPGKPYGSSPTDIIIKNNVWQRGISGKCGAIAATTSFLNANGNQWINNHYDDGTILNP